MRNHFESLSTTFLYFTLSIVHIDGLGIVIMVKLYKESEVRKSCLHNSAAQPSGLWKMGYCLIINASLHSV